MNRAQRRAQGKDIRAQIKTQVFNQEKDSLRRHLEKTEAEMRDSLEHVYNGMYFATMAIAMHRCRLSQNTIYKAMSMADDLYGQLFDGKLTADDLEKMVVEEAGIKIEYDADRQYMILRPFERTKDGKKAYYNLTGLMKVQESIFWPCLKGEHTMSEMRLRKSMVLISAGRNTQGRWIRRKGSLRTDSSGWKFRY